MITWLAVLMTGVSIGASIQTLVHVFIKRRAESFEAVREFPREANAFKAARLEAECVRAGYVYRRSFSAFTTCTGCGVEGFHLLAEPRTLTEDVARLGGVNPGGLSYITSARAGEQRQVRSDVFSKQTVSVVDRECLSCGKTWEELA